MNLVRLPLMAALLMGAMPASAERSTPLGELEPVSVSQGWGALQYDRSVQGNPLRIGHRTFAHGFGTHAKSEIAYLLDGPAERFECWVGVDAEMTSFGKSSVVFRVVADGKTVFDSGVMHVDTPARRVVVPLTGVRRLTLQALDGGDDVNGDHADWCEPVLIGVATYQPSPAPRYTVRAKGLTVRLSADGNIVASALGARTTQYAVRGMTTLAGCRQVGKPVAKKVAGGWRFIRRVRSVDGQECTLRESFAPGAGSIRWNLVIRGEGPYWTAPLTTVIQWPASGASRFWAPWSSPDPIGREWRNPLAPQPFRAMRLGYGAGGGYFGGAGNFIGLPLASALEPAKDAGLTVALSPEDTLLGLTVSSRADGTMRFTRSGYRIGGGKELRFALDLVPHEADPRGGLRWMVARYPRFFDPPLKRAGEIAGCGAYSSHEGPIDLAKVRRMAFRVNWKASFDFPYMGMFLPAVPGDDETWPRFDADSGGSPIAGRHTETSRRQMNEYNRRMRADGFYVLNYFNVTEFGARIEGPENAVARPPGELWRNPTDFLYGRIADGILPGPDSKPMRTWGGAVVMDPGGPSYRSFLLEQARRHVEKLPDSAGICIDRTDWLALTNPHGDDGVSWRDGKPVRSLLLSWKSLVSDLAPLMHGAGKAIFINTHLVRLEMLRQVDGIYCEFGDDPAYLNAVAFAAMRKPVIQWTGDDRTLRRDPDSFFQRHLYLGMFPTAPFPGNDHTIQPSEWAERQYERYGPLLEKLRGKRWVLSKRPVQVSGSTALGNAFEVGGGYIVPVVFGGQAASARLELNLPGVNTGWHAEALLPDERPAEKVPLLRAGGRLTAEVPLGHGCALLVLRRTADSPASSAAPMSARRTLEGQVELLEGDKPILRYNHRTIEPGALLEKVSESNRIYARARSDYIHPLYGLNGEELTRDWPIDHPHHRGIYWAWPEVDYRGERGDLHALQRVFARPVGTPVITKSADSIGITAMSRWMWDDKEAIVDEKAEIRAYRASPAGRFIDLTLTFTAIREPVSLARRGTDHYGGLNIRLAPVAGQQTRFYSDPPEAKPRVAWSDLSGTFPGAQSPSGLTVLQSGQNPDYPGDWVQYPELNWLQPTFPAAKTRYMLQPGTPLTLRFRLWIHAGEKLPAERFGEQWLAFDKSQRPQN